MKKIFILLALIGIGILLFFLFSKPGTHKDESNSPAPPVKSHPQTQTNINKKKPVSHDLAARKIRSKKRIEKTMEEPLIKTEKPAEHLQTKQEQPANASSTGKPPRSYSVQEADRYFVPPEERRPGHLGGPPPLPMPPQPGTSPTSR